MLSNTACIKNFDIYIDINDMTAKFAYSSLFLSLQSSLLESCSSPLYNLECEEDENRRQCQLLCRRNGTVNSLVNQQCSDEQIEVFCGEEFEDGDCHDLPLFNEDCDERPMTCILMCTGNMRTLDRRCRQEVRRFCVG